MKNKIDLEGAGYKILLICRFLVDLIEIFVLDCMNGGTIEVTDKVFFWSEGGFTL